MKERVESIVAARFADCTDHKEGEWQGKPLKGARGPKAHNTDAHGQRGAANIDLHQPGQPCNRVKARGSRAFAVAIEPAAARRLHLALRAMPISADSTKAANHASVKCRRCAEHSATKWPAGPRDRVRRKDAGRGNEVG